MNAIQIVQLSRNIRVSYEKVCENVIAELGMPQVALDILLFLGNNPDYDTAKDIGKYRGIKPNLISLYVDKLVDGGYLVRMPARDDRRQIHLQLTAKAEPILRQGREVQKTYAAKLENGLTEEEKAVLFTALEKVNHNAADLTAGKTEDAGC